MDPWKGSTSLPKWRITIRGNLYSSWLFPFMSPVPPYLVRISDENLSRYYHNNTNITITAGEAYDITCAAYGAIPPAVLKWRIADNVAVVLQDQANGVQGYSYISLKTATITPSRDDQGKYLRCLASHPKLQHHLQRSVYLNVHG